MTLWHWTTPIYAIAFQSQIHLHVHSNICQKCIFATISKFPILQGALYAWFSVNFHWNTLHFLLNISMNYSDYHQPKCVKEMAIVCYSPLFTIVLHCFNHVHLVPYFAYNTPSSLISFGSLLIKVMIVHTFFVRLICFKFLLQWKSSYWSCHFEDVMSVSRDGTKCFRQR